MHVVQKNWWLDQLIIDSQNDEIAALKANAQKFEDCVSEASVNIEDVGDELLDNWYDYVYDRWSYYDSPDDVIESTMSYMSYEVDLAKEQREEIEEIYSKLKAPNGDAKYKELVRLAEDFYNAYIEFYDFVIDPSGSYTSYSSGYSDLKDELIDAYEEYSEYLNTLE